MRVSEFTQRCLDRIIEDEGLNYLKYAKRTNDFCSIFSQNLSSYSKVLDVGVGTGYFDVLLRCEIGCEVYAIDLWREGALENQQRYLSRLEEFGVNFQYCDITKESLPHPEGTFDCVLFLEVLEHLIVAHPPLGILTEFNRILKKDGILILSTPNVARLTSRVQCLLGKHPSSHGFKDERPYAKHLREYTPSELRWMLERSGFEVVDMLFVDHDPPVKGLTSSLIYLFRKLWPKFRNNIIIKGKKGSH